jgi:FtsH-binding integral membrane protein
MTFSLFALAIICIIVNGYQQPLTENRYIMNTYMYILLALITVSSTVIYLDSKTWEMNTMHFFGLFILSITTMYATIITSPENYIVKHLSWIIFLITIGTMIYPTAKIALMKGEFWNIILTLGCILGVLSIIAFRKPLGTFLSWGNMLTVALSGLIIFEIFDILFNKQIDSYMVDIGFFTRSRIYAWIGILVFSGFMLYDTQKIILHAKIYREKCESVIGIDQLMCVDYPNESLGIFLDIVNLFSSLTRVS